MAARVKSCVKAGAGEVALADITLPDPGPGEALIRTTLTTLCGSDLHLIDELPSIPAGLPQGHEGVGVVEAIGEGVERFAVGDRVVSSCTVGCGQCGICRLGEVQLCSTYGAPLNILFGCQGEAYSVRSADVNLAPIPEGMSDRQALLAADILSTGFAAIERGRLRAGQSVAIFAQGPVGLCATIAARHHGAGRIIAVESVPERAALARQLGADEVLPPEGAAQAIRERTQGMGVDLAIDAVGKVAAFEAALQAIRIGGTVSTVGVYTGVDALRLPINATFFQHTVVTSYCPGGRERLAYLLGLIESGAIDPLPLFTHERPLSEITGAYDQFRARRDGAIKIAITP